MSEVLLGVDVSNGPNTWGISVVSRIARPFGMTCGMRLV